MFISTKTKAPFVNFTHQFSNIIVRVYFLPQSYFGEMTAIKLSSHINECHQTKIRASLCLPRLQAPLRRQFFFSLAHMDSVTN